MGMKEQVYSVLIATATDRPEASLSSFFKAPIFSPVTVVSCLNAAKRAFSERSFDLVVVNSPLPDGSGAAFALETAQRAHTAVLFLARSGMYDEEYGVFVSNGVFLLRKPVARSVFEVAAGWMISARELMRKSEEQAQTLEEKMKEIRIVNRAKWLLISKENMTEPEAHRFIEKQAMDKCVSKRTVAEGIIRSFEQT